MLNNVGMQSGIVIFGVIRNFSYDRMRKTSKISPPSNQPHFFKIILSILYQQKYEITLKLIFCCVNLYCTDMFQSNNAKLL